MDGFVLDSKPWQPLKLVHCVLQDFCGQAIVDLEDVRVLLSKICLDAAHNFAGEEISFDRSAQGAG